MRTLHRMRLAIPTPSIRPRYRIRRQRAVYCAIPTASRIVHGRKTNCVLATIGLFVSVFKLFTRLLSLLGWRDASD